MLIAVTRGAVPTKNIPTIPIVPAIKTIRATPISVDTGNGPITAAVITATTIIEGIGIPIKAIGGLGNNGMNTQESTRTFINTAAIIGKIHT